MTIVVYTKATCPYCVRAKALLAKKGAAFQEIEITDKPALRTEMIEKANGRTTVPQIFINGRHIGGCDDLHALEDQGKLDALLRP
jgi:glutaredoxin 3